MSAQVARRKTGAKRTRDQQRLVHMLTGVLLIVYVYAPAQPGSFYEAGIRWVALPLLAAGGVMMWQWPKVRRWARQRGDGR